MLLKIIKWVTSIYRTKLFHISCKDKPSIILVCLFHQIKSLFCRKHTRFIDNPNKPAQVKPLSVVEYKAMRDSGKPHLLLDVRTQGERDTSMIQGSELLDDEMMERLMELDRATTIVCQCHHGVRSRNAAHQLVAIGFRDVFNLTGGIDAWSDIDASVPKY